MHSLAEFKSLHSDVKVSFRKQGATGYQSYAQLLQEVSPDELIMSLLLITEGAS